MGLKQDLIDAKVKAAKDTDMAMIDTSDGSYIEREAEYMKEAIVDFLTQCEFRITKINAPVILENFKIPPQQADVLPNVVSQHLDSVSGVPITSRVIIGKDGVLTNEVNVDKSSGETGILESTGYVYIGEDPETQDGFDVGDESGQREFTQVKLIREDIEDLL